jgi:hypothetical protein
MAWANSHEPEVEPVEGKRCSCSASKVRPILMNNQARYFMQRLEGHMQGKKASLLHSTHGPPYGEANHASSGGIQAWLT